jgi:hypothetical protein
MPKQTQFKPNSNPIQTHRPGTLALSRPRLLDYVPPTALQKAKIVGITYMKMQSNILKFGGY